MADNPITGETTVTLGDETYRLQYTWGALARIAREYGEDANLFDPTILAKVTEIGLHRHHPEMTAERIVDISPPIVDVIASVHAALNLAYFGPKGPPGGGGENPLMARSRAAARKTPSTGSNAPSSSASAPASDPATSGT